MKKLKLMLLSLFILIFSVGCNGVDSKLPSQTEVLDALTLEVLDKPLAKDIELPTELKIDEYSFPLTYRSDMPEYFKIVKGENKITAQIKQPVYADLKGKLEVKIGYSTVNLYKEFEFTILKGGSNPNPNPDPSPNPEIAEDGFFNTKEEVSLYIVTYHKLPSNYYKKSEFSSMKKKWTKENKISCGGDHFGNYEGLLPEGDSYIECDIDYRGKDRGTKRIVFSLKTLNVFYTGDHYKHFTQLYDHGKKVY